MRNKKNDRKVRSHKDPFRGEYFATWCAKYSPEHIQAFTFLQYDLFNKLNGVKETYGFYPVASDSDLPNSVKSTYAMLFRFRSSENYRLLLKKV